MKKKTKKVIATILDMGDGIFTKDDIALKAGVSLTCAYINIKEMQAANCISMHHKVKHTMYYSKTKSPKIDKMVKTRQMRKRNGRIQAAAMNAKKFGVAFNKEAFISKLDGVKPFPKIEIRVDPESVKDIHPMVLNIAITIRIDKDGIKLISK